MSAIIVICAILRFCIGMVRCSNAFSDTSTSRTYTRTERPRVVVRDPPTTDPEPTPDPEPEPDPEPTPGPAPKSVMLKQIPHEELSIDDMEHPPSGSFKGACDSTCHGFMIIKNNTKSLLDIRADFTYKDVNGTELETSYDNARSVSPGDSAVLVSSYFNGTGTLAETAYEITCENTDPSRYPSIKDNFTIEVISENEKELVLRYTNTGKEPQELYHALWLGTDETGYMQACNCFILGLPDSTLKPGESYDLEFSTIYLFDENNFTAWDDYKDWSCYVSGYGLVDDSD